MRPQRLKVPRPPTQANGSDGSALAVPLWKWFGPSKSPLAANGSLLLVSWVCQLATIWITWPLWQLRDAPPNLSTLAIDGCSFGALMVASLIAVLLRPPQGVVLHWIVLIVASLFDQTRLQPQFFSLALLMAACVWPSLLTVTRWFLASTWLWAGLHKFLSPDWFGFASHWVVERSGIGQPDRMHLPVALSIALTELVVGLLACVRPRAAAIACVPMHLGIILMLSPLALDWNASVIPWNLAMAIVGSAVMWWAGKRSAADRSPGARRLELAVAVAWIIAPLGFFVGWIDHGFAGVLYSDSIPRGRITRDDGTHDISGWGELAVPFPNERRTLRMYFENVADPGDKLHISDPRWMLEDLHFVLDDRRRAEPIDVDTFFDATPTISGTPSVMGVGLDSPRSVFALRRAGVRMVRESLDQPIYAVAFTPENFQRELLRHLPGLVNLRQIQFAETSVRDADLRHLSRLRMLTGLGLSGTAVTDQGLEHLSGLPYLQYIEAEDTAITPAGITRVLRTAENATAE